MLMRHLGSRGTGTELEPRWISGILIEERCISSERTARAKKDKGISEGHSAVGVGDGTWGRRVSLGADCKGLNAKLRDWI